MASKSAICFWHYADISGGFNFKYSRMGELGQKHYDFYFSKNHWLVRKAGNAGEQKEKEI